MDNLEQMRKLIILYRDTVGLNSDIKIEDNMIVIDDWIFVSEAKILRKTIKGYIKVDGWDLGKSVLIPGNRDYPDTHDVEDVLQSQNRCEIAKRAILLIFENKMDSCVPEECFDEHDISNNLKE